MNTLSFNITGLTVFMYYDQDLINDKIILLLFQTLVFQIAEDIT